MTFPLHIQESFRHQQQCTYQSLSQKDNNNKKGHTHINSNYIAWLGTSDLHGMLITSRFVYLKASHINSRQNQLSF